MTAVRPVATHARPVPRRRSRPLRDLLVVDDDVTTVRPPDVGGTAAWQALVRDGVLVALRGDVACVAGTLVGPSLRASALRQVVPTGAVVGGRTATWVHTGTDDGGLLDLLCHPGGRRPAPSAGSRLRQVPLLSPDVRTFAGVPVTAPGRTAVELALHDDDPVDRLVALARAGVDLDAVRRAVLLRPRVGTREAAVRHLESAARLLRPLLADRPAVPSHPA